MATECRELVVDGQDNVFVPSISPNTSALGGRGPNGQTLLQETVEILENATFVERATIDLYYLYLEELVGLCVCVYVYIILCVCIIIILLLLCVCMHVHYDAGVCTCMYMYIYTIANLTSYIPITLE